MSCDFIVIIFFSHNPLWQEVRRRDEWNHKPEGESFFETNPPTSQNRSDGNCRGSMPTDGRRAGVDPNESLSDLGRDRADDH
jgi:hypothetical protein